MILSEFLDINELHSDVRNKYINAVISQDARHTIYNYTDKAQYAGVWTKAQRVCRGLVVKNNTGVVVARGFDKFFNVNEHGVPEVTAETLLARTDAVEITDKLDGSMVLLWFDAEMEVWRTSTRGSFTSRQAHAALQWLQNNNVLMRADPHYTYIGEWCAPDNRVVLPYATAAWRLIGVRKPDGYDAIYNELVSFAHALGVPVVHATAHHSLADVIAEAPCAENVEGWVIRWPDGSRVKVKTASYLTLHRMLLGLNPRHVQECLVSGTLDSYLAQVPEEFRAEIESMRDAIVDAATARENTIRAIFDTIAHYLNDSQKAFALAVQTSAPRNDWPWYFALAKQQPITHALLKNVDTTAINIV